MLTLTREDLKLHQDPRNCYICGTRIFKKLAKSKHYRKFKVIIAIIQVNVEGYHIVFII